MNNDAFLVLFIGCMTLMCMIPLFLRRFRVPGVIALLLVGMLMGPNALDLISLLSRGLGFLGANPADTSAKFYALVSALGSLGLVLLMSLAGMEADFKLIKAAKLPVLSLSCLTFLLPAVTGFAVYNYFRPDDLPGKLLYASLFASHSVGIVFPVIRELKLTKTRFGAAVLISTVITDVASIILLAVSVQLKKQTLAAAGAVAVGHKTLSIFDYMPADIFGSWFLPVFLLIVLLYMLIAILVVYKLGNRLLSMFHPGEDMLLPILLLVILGTVLIGEFLGGHLVVGAFIAGLALSRLVKPKPGEVPLISRFESIGYGLLVPFLFVSIGMQSDFSAFTTPGNLVIIGLTVAGLVASKIFSGWLAMRMVGFDNLHGVCAGLMTVPQLSATLAAAAIGRDLGMLDDNFFNAIIVLSIVTTLPVPSLVRWVIERGQMKFKTVRTEAYPLPSPKDDGSLF